MPRIAYIVTATIPDDATCERYIRWLEDGHVDDVINGGAHSGMIIRLERDNADSPHQVETHYVFATRETFEKYERESAPALRAEGLEKFSPESGIEFSRRLGEII